MQISKPYNKAVVPMFVGFLAALLPTFGIDWLSNPEVQNAVTAIATSLLVYFIPNAPKK